MCSSTIDQSTVLRCCNQVGALSYGLVCFYPVVFGWIFEVPFCSRVVSRSRKCAASAHPAGLLRRTPVPRPRSDLASQVAKSLGLAASRENATHKVGTSFLPGRARADDAEYLAQSPVPPSVEECRRQIIADNQNQARLASVTGKTQSARRAVIGTPQEQRLLGDDRFFLPSGGFDWNSRILGDLRVSL